MLRDHTGIPSAVVLFFVISTLHKAGMPVAGSWQAGCIRSFVLVHFLTLYSTLYSPGCLAGLVGWQARVGWLVGLAVVGWVGQCQWSSSGWLGWAVSVSSGGWAVSVVKVLTLGG